MGDGPASAGGKGEGSVFGQFFTHVFDMPRWHKLVLTVAGIIGAVGVGGHVTNAVSGTPETSPSVRTAPDSAGRSGFVSDTGAPRANAATLKDDPSFKGLLIRNAPWMTRVGIGFIGAFIIGWVFRAFIKLMTMMTVVVALLLGGLSYFRVVDIDFSKAQEEYSSASAWVSDQATKAKDALLEHIPMSMSSTLGMFLGFRRK